VAPASGEWIRSATEAHGGAVEPQGLPMFSEVELVILDQLPFDPAARGNFEWLSGGLM